MEAADLTLGRGGRAWLVRLVVSLSLGSLFACAFGSFVVTFVFFHPWRDCGGGGLPDLYSLPPPAAALTTHVCLYSCPFSSASGCGMDRLGYLSVFLFLLCVLLTKATAQEDEKPLLVVIEEKDEVELFTQVVSVLKGEERKKAWIGRCF